ncbi:MAG TPA: hypothetical protein VK457_11020 [Chloroflexota bacterium]|nr:hypothetical protein [Chloroflexota bacterium]
MAWVAIDPAPCLGDAAFDTVDLILWQADDRETIQARAPAVADRPVPDQVNGGRSCAYPELLVLENCEHSSHCRSWL